MSHVATRDSARALQRMADDGASPEELKRLCEESANPELREAPMEVEQEAQTAARRTRT